MKLTAKKAFGKIHLWLGLSSGAIIMIVALNCAIYVFSDDIIAITESGFTRVMAENTKPLLPSQLTAIALKERKRFLGEKKIAEWDWASLYIFNDSCSAVRFSSRHYKNPDQFTDILSILTTEKFCIPGIPMLIRFGTLLSTCTHLYCLAMQAFT